MPDPRRRPDHQHVALIRLTEPVVAHRRLALGAAGVDVLAVQQLQRHPDLRELLVDPIPVRLRVNTVVLTTPCEQSRIHVRFLEVGDVVPADALPVGRVEHHGHAGAGHALRGDLPAREPLRAQPKHELRLDLAYHPNHSFCRVIGHAAEGA